MINNKFLKYIFSKFRRAYAIFYFFVIKKILGKNVTFGKINFYQRFVLDVNAKKFKLSIGNVMFKEDCTVRIRENGNLIIKDNVFFNRGCSINCLNSIEIKENTLFGENVKLYDHNHKFRNKSELIKNQGYSLGNIKIGSNCWIGSNTVILKNVHIGNNVVVGANCLIFKDVPSNSIVKNRSQIEIIEY